MLGQINERLRKGRKLEGQEDKQMMDAQTDRWRKKTAERAALR